ncbi:NAD(P)H-hydrate epimerase [Candidatus Pacearchaeota archaeon]|nr:MAG: NAD(P)H-hydrate epimerase [Candidatus Pacearchaeota archaeon]
MPSFPTLEIAPRKAKKFKPLSQVQNMIPYLTSEQMAQVDALAIEWGIDIPRMMENAGRNFARFVFDELSPSSVCVLYGKGNNGADGLVAARYLHLYGVREIRILPASSEGNEFVKHNLAILEKLGIRPTEELGKCDLVIDALLGYNLKGAPRGSYAELIRKANELKNSGARIAAFDLPSGLDPNTGTCAGECIKADYTLTLALPKIALKLAPKDVVGKAFVVNLGLPAELYSALGISVPTDLFSRSDVVPLKENE